MKLPAAYDEKPDRPAQIQSCALRRWRDRICQSAAYGYPLVYRRWLGSDEFLICINPLDVPEAYPVGEGWQTALANQDAAIEQGQLTLKPFGYVILKKRV